MDEDTNQSSVDLKPSVPATPSKSEKDIENEDEETLEKTEKNDTEKSKDDQEDNATEQTHHIVIPSYRQKLFSSTIFRLIKNYTDWTVNDAVFRCIASWNHAFFLQFSMQIRSDTMKLKLF